MPPALPDVTPRPPYVPPRPSYQAPGYYDPPSTTFRTESLRPPATSKYHTDVGAVIKVATGGDTQRFPKSKLTMSHENGTYL